jgi:hypothetical protein
MSDRQVLCVCVSVVAAGCCSTTLVCKSCGRGRMIRTYEYRAPMSFAPIDVNNSHAVTAGSSIVDAHPLAPRFRRSALRDLLRSPPAFYPRAICSRPCRANARRLAHPNVRRSDRRHRILPASAVTRAAAPSTSLSKRITG